MEPTSLRNVAVAPVQSDADGGTGGGPDGYHHAFNYCSYRSPPRWRLVRPRTLVLIGTRRARSTVVARNSDVEYSSSSARQINSIGADRRFVTAGNPLRARRAHDAPRHQRS